MLYVSFVAKVTQARLSEGEKETDDSSLIRGFLFQNRK